MICLIDGDVIIYRAAFGAESSFTRVVDGQKIKTREAAPPEEAFANADVMLANINRQYPNSYFLLCTSGGSNFRKLVDPNYKANRKPEDKPLLFDDLNQYLAGFNSVSVPYLEADDIMSIIQLQEPRETVICTIDKDLNTVPGEHYNFVEDVAFDVSYHDASYLLAKQMLTGDRTDNIQGIRGVGDKKAEKLLSPLEDSLDDVWQAVYDRYKVDYGEDTSVMDKNLLLLSMLTDYKAVPCLTEEQQGQVNEAFESILNEISEWKG